MVKNIVGLRVQMRFGSKWWHMQIPKKVIIRRFRQMIEDIEGAPANGFYNVYERTGTTALTLTSTINSNVASHGNANGVDITVRIKDESSSAG